MKNGNDFNSVSFLDKEHLKYLYLSPQGRINRQRIWLGGLLLGLVWIPTVIAYVILSAIGSFLAIVGILLFISVGIGMAIAELMLFVKRAHDRNHSGWYIFPLIGIIFQLELLFLKGNSDTNDYGMDPNLGPLLLNPQSFFHQLLATT